jgi:steroid delta-isomerase-like uncharacterized protein
MTDNAATAQTLFDAWEKRDFDTFSRQLADDVSLNDAPRGQVVNGQANVRDWYASWVTAFPDAVAGATVVCASGETVAIEGLFAGSNTGDFGPLPATGKSVSSPWVNVLHFDHDGRIIAGSVYYDQLTIMIQLGHIDAPATT